MGLAPKIRFERAKGAPEPPADHTATAQLPHHPLIPTLCTFFFVCACMPVCTCLLTFMHALSSFVHADIHPGIGINQYGCPPEFMHLQLRFGASCFEFMKSLSKKSA